MCGLAGILHWGSLSDAAQRVHNMTNSMIHRGPDDNGYWHDKNIALGFRRLSILDLLGGHQPMPNEDKTVWVIFNGQIYNHLELRKELIKLGHHFRSDHSDTEVLVHGWEEWKEDLPSRLNGMFAFAIWDQNQKTLFLARDRYGIKPLYFSNIQNNGLIFASEIRAIHQSGLIEKQPNMEGILEYFSQQNLYNEQTMFSNISQFSAATWMKILPHKTIVNQYWDYNFNRSNHLSLKDATEQHRAILQNVVSRQMTADVPVSCYLSGGIDSSALACAASKINRNVKTYACIFDLNDVGDDKIVDEREFSRQMAAYLGSDHTELQLPQNALIDNLESTILSLEDLRMGMAYVNYLIAQCVSKDCKVVLSGLGGDELHGGYLYRYQATKPKISKHVPFSTIFKNKFFQKTISQSFSDELKIYKTMLNFPIAESLQNVAFTPNFLINTKQYSVQNNLENQIKNCQAEHIWDKVMHIDARTYMQGLLMLEDRLSMAHSLEVRVPLLDNELVDFVSTMPWTYLNDGETGKILFRESVKPWVPCEIYQKPKMGFGPPDASWYRGALRPFIEKLLSKKTIEQRGIFQPNFVINVLEEHFSNRANHVALIWSLICFEMWCRVFNMFGGLSVLKS